MKTLDTLYLPELGAARKGSVRDLYEQSNELLMVTSDRISCFDQPLAEQIPHKGQILTEIATYWFDQTKDILKNHLVSYPDPNVMVAKRCKPLEVEVIVRGFLAGSLAEAYENGTREAYGLTLPEGLKRNDPFPEPIITPTTKSHHGHDEPITPEELIKKELVTQEQWSQIIDVALKLFMRGQEIAKTRGLTLVDTKYEFGLDAEGDLILIDEIHTPDSSRYWFPDGAQMRVPDKQFVRDWLATQGFTGEGTPPALPQEIIEEASARYQALYEQLLGKPFLAGSAPVKQRVVQNLQREGRIIGRCALIAMGSESDRPHAEKITKVFEEHGIPVEVVVASAHKQPQKVMELMERYNASSEPVVVIGIAGRSNALTGVLAANMRWPVIACPPFSDKSDYLVNIHSSLQMPSGTPALTVIDPGNAALAAIKILEVGQ